jgi:hypothetical protein
MITKRCNDAYIIIIVQICISSLAATRYLAASKGMNWDRNKSPRWIGEWFAAIQLPGTD